MAKGKKGEIKTSCQYSELQQTQMMYTKPGTAVCSRLLYSILFKSITGITNYLTKNTFFTFTKP